MDRESVISALHCKAQDLMIDPPACDECGYQIQMVNRRGCNYRQLCRDALALLKNLEPKQVEAEVINEIDRLYRCPSCHISMILRKQPYCHSCGQAVKWE